MSQYTMSHDRQVSIVRNRTRDDNSDSDEDEMELIAIVSGFIMVVVGAWFNRGLLDCGYFYSLVV